MVGREKIRSLRSVSYGKREKSEKLNHGRSGEKTITEKCFLREKVKRRKNHGIMKVFGSKRYNVVAIRYNAA